MLQMRKQLHLIQQTLAYYEQPTINSLSLNVFNDLVYNVTEESWPVKTC